MKPSKSKRPTTARRPRRKCNTCGELLEALEKEAPPPVNVRALEGFRASRGQRSPRPVGWGVRFKTYTARRAVAQFERLLADVAAGCVVEITRRGRVVASVLAPAKLETLEILANPQAVSAIRAFKAGKTKSLSLSEFEAELEAGERRKPTVKETPDWRVILDRKQPRVSRAGQVKRDARTGLLFFAGSITTDEVDAAVEHINPVRE